jgi:hypothetical protein
MKSFAALKAKSQNNFYVKSMAQLTTSNEDSKANTFSNNPVLEEIPDNLCGHKRTFQGNLEEEMGEQFTKRQKGSNLGLD